MRILVTGAAGQIGHVLLPGLADRGHEVVGLDLVPSPDGVDVPWHCVDCTDPDAVLDALGDPRVDAVVHLAGNPDESSLPVALDSHVTSTAALLDAMVHHHIDRIVYASSNHAVGRTPRAALAGDPLGVDVPPRPDTFYGVGKVAAEALLRLYADRYAIDAVACRIGSFLPEPSSERHLATWLSHDDAVRMVDAALTAPAPGFAVLYGVSANTRGWWDLEAGRALGYHPADDAEEFADRVGRSTDDDAEAAHVGGPFVDRSLHRAALDRPRTPLA